MLDDSKPIFIQIKEQMEDQIVNEQLKEHDQMPSTTQLVQFYKVNHLTIAKGMNLLVEAGLIYKKRGIGMYVAEGAREKLMVERRQQFFSQFVRPLLEEAAKLGMGRTEIIQMLDQDKEEGGTEHES